MLHIDKPEMFKEALSKGINIFAGAGFSKLPDSNGKYLPTANELCDDICSAFSISTSLNLDLEQISSLVNLKAKDRFQSYLREKYTVTEYNPLYDTLNEIALNSFITTNIDNIVQCVMDHSKRYSLHDIAVYGAHKRGSGVVTYIPLHGNVKDLTSHLYFGKSELANVDNDNRALFSAMESKLYEAPTLFWGYGFHDHAIERTIVKVLEKRPKDIWVQCMPGDKSIDFFRALGCYVIEATTDELLQWIKKEIKVTKVSTEGRDYSTIKQYFVPSRNQLATVSLQDYYQYGRTNWYCILSNYAYETNTVNELYENSLMNKNVVAVGIPFSGKTTILMQLAAKSQESIKLIVEGITVEEAKRIINVLDGSNCLVFIEECCEDAYVTRLFMEQENIRVVGFTNDYAFESAKHIWDSVTYSKEYIDELESDDAQRIYQYIPQTIRKKSFTYKRDENEKYSMLEFLGQNVQGVVTRKKVKELLRRIKSSSWDAFQVVALATYLSNNESALSVDILFSYFGLVNYEQVQDLICATQGYLASYDIGLLNDALDQDYYSLRSNMFAYIANQILQEDFKREYGGVIRRFIFEVSPYKVYHYYIFKRSAFDARLFKKLFFKNAHDIYEFLVRYDDGAYALQQWALYKAYLGDYSGAFADIDRAISMNPYNFSIRNSRAIILFEANKEKSDSIALEGLKEAMDTLQRCFTSDKRKVYHAQKYAEFALYYSQIRGIPVYLSQAHEWLEQLISTKESTSKQTKRLFIEVEKEIKRSGKINA